MENTEIPDENNLSENPNYIAHVLLSRMYTLVILFKCSLLTWEAWITVKSFRNEKPAPIFARSPEIIQHHNYIIPRKLTFYFV